MRKILINEKTKEARCAVIEKEQVTEVHQSSSSDDEIVGNIYLGRVKKVLPGMQAAFVDIGLSQNGYLHRNELVSFQLSKQVESKSSISHYVKEGEQLLVQVIKVGTDQKGPKLTTNIEFGGKYLVYMPFGNYQAVSKKITDENERNRLLTFTKKICEDQEGILLRTASQDGTIEQLTNEYLLLKEKFLKIKNTKSRNTVRVYEAKSFVERLLSEMVIQDDDALICDDIARFKDLKQQYPDSTIMYHDKKEGIFTFYRVEQELDKLLKHIVWLKNGSYIIIEQTEAMTIIDVNTGKFSGKLSMRDTVLKTNQLAAIEIARQVRLRNLSGIILIDFIDMKHKQDQLQIVDSVIQEMKKDRVQHKVLGFTELNILQITRKKTRLPLENQVTEKCKVCNGTGRIPSAETVAFKLERELWEHQFMDQEAMWVEATNEVIQLLKGENGEHLKQLEEALRFKVMLTEYQHTIPGYNIKQIGSLSSITERIIF